MARARAIALALLIASSGCSSRALRLGDGASAPPLEGGSSAHDTAALPPAPCAEAGYRCAGRSIVHCSAPGDAPTPVSDCASLDLPGLSYGCGSCSGKPSSAACVGDAPHIVSTFTWQGAERTVSAISGCPAIPSAVATFGFPGYAFLHQIRLAEGTIRFVLVFPASALPASGASRPLNHTAGGADPPFGVYASLGGPTCSNEGTAPAAGSVVLSYAGKKRGDAFTLAAKGQLTCDGSSWLPFSYEAAGMIAVE